METIKRFSNTEFGTVRVVTKDGQAYIVGKDVAEALGYMNPRDAIRTHVDNEDKGVVILDTLGGRQETTVINESGMYSLIFGSRMESAKRFKRWVTNEVLPSIRKNGLYATEELLNNPDLIIKLATEIKNEREKSKLLESKVDDLKPKAEFYDCVADSKTAFEMSEVAKILGNVGRNTLFSILRQEKVLRQNNTPYQKYMDTGWFNVVEVTYKRYAEDLSVNIKTLVYQKGIDGIRKILKNHKEIKK